MLADAGLLSHGWTWHPLRPSPSLALVAMPLFLLKQVLLLLVEIMNLLSKCGLLRSVIRAQNIGSLQRLGLGSRIVHQALYHAQWSGKTPVLSITKSGRGLGLEIKLSTTPIGQGKAAEHANMYNRERQVEHLYEIMQRPP